MTRPLSFYSPAMVHEFYALYYAIVVLSICKYLGLMIHMDQPQLDEALMGEVRVDLSEETIHQVIFGPDYITAASTAECDYRLRVIHDRHIM